MGCLGLLWLTASREEEARPGTCIGKMSIAQVGVAALGILLRAMAEILIGKSMHTVVKSIV